MATVGTVTQPWLQMGGHGLGAMVGRGADSVEVYAFEDFVFVDDDSGIGGAYATFLRRGR